MGDYREEVGTSSQSAQRRNLMAWSRITTYGELADGVNSLALSAASRGTFAQTTQCRSADGCALTVATLVELGCTDMPCGMFPEEACFASLGFFGPQLRNGRELKDDQ